MWACSTGCSSGNPSSRSVRMLITLSSGEANIFPSPVLPRRAPRMIASMASSRLSEGTAISSFTLGSMSGRSGPPFRLGTIFSLQPWPTHSWVVKPNRPAEMRVARTCCRRSIGVEMPGARQLGADLAPVLAVVRRGATRTPSCGCGLACPNEPQQKESRRATQTERMTER